ncbi:hypothetical protein BDY17DRAFT_297527 [Neohortaea acidophila]|uniref:FAD-binding domain-containing protein n=1 Tax=Neohortaea acidophila TaxID=245834 RepID=A0A6A6PTS0_9PEZI|nr:uncharacterized protein BDY17DRAFT_297527 [Neohortaea acidophila]KAF2483509.1 hypothetical protein BDY17DRAFT_297527 [Neohortaea acidophila]
MPKLKVLISGGGVAGTALAFWLSKLNHDVTVVEHFSTLRTTGLQIDLRGHGIEVLKRMGLESAFRAKAAPEEGMQFVDRAGRNRAYFGANKTGSGAQGITSDYEIMRGDLCRIIHDATGESAKYVFGTSVTSIRQTGDGVEATFRDGHTEKYDLLVGCDGAFSSTRKMMLAADDATAGFNPIGDYNAYMTFKRPIEEGERYVGMMYLATEKRALLTRRHSPEDMQLYLLMSKADPRLLDVRRGDVEAEKQAFAEIFRDAGWRTPELLKEMQQADDFYCERIGIVKLDSWHEGHVALLGDAASSPGGSGMGTSCAMIGAYVLAGEIGRQCGRGDDSPAETSREGVPAALKAYDDRFRPFMDIVQKGLDNPPSFLMPSSAWAIALVHVVLQVASWLWIDPVMQYFMKEKASQWSLPEYEELRDSERGVDAEP